MCYSCGVKTTDGAGVKQPKRTLPTGLVEFSIPADGFPARKIDYKTAAHWRYGYNHKKSCHVANYCDRDGNVVGQKLRFEGKRFSWVGSNDVGLYGSWLWRRGGRMLIITEGEIDALTVSRMQGNRWPCASLPHGKDSAEAAIAKDSGWVESFDKVVLMFDSDEAGRAAATKAARLLTPGKTYIASLPLKDANAMLVAGRGDEIIKASWNAVQWRPEGIVRGDDVWKRVVEAAKPSLASYPFPRLQEALKGARPGETTLIAAGSGAGKSTFVRSLTNHWIDEGLTVGVIPLEETVGQFTRRTLGQRVGTNPGINGVNLAVFKAEWAQIQERVVLYDDGGDRSHDSVLDQIRFMALADKCDIIILDNLTMIMGGRSGKDSLSYIDSLILEIESLVKRTGVSLFVVVHLRKSGAGSKDKAYEQGRVITLDDIRSSGYISIVSHNVIALERDQQGDDPNRLHARILKARETGRTGPAGELRFEPDTGRLVPADPDGLGPDLFNDETQQKSPITEDLGRF